MMGAGFRIAALWAAMMALASVSSGGGVSPHDFASVLAPHVASSLVPALAPVPVREGLILINFHDLAKRDQPAVLFTPEGKEVDRFAMGAAAQPPSPGEIPNCGLFDARLSQDGRRLAALGVGPTNLRIVGLGPPLQLWVFELEDKKGPVKALTSEMRTASLAWSQDGNKVFVSQVDPAKVTDPVEKGKALPMISWVHDFQTQKKTTLALPQGHEIADASADGKFLLTRLRPGLERDTESAHMIALDTLNSRKLTVQPFRAMRFSPDGKQVIGYRTWKDDDRPAPGVLVVVSVADDSERTIALPDGATSIQHACWSPDGKRIAYIWRGRKEISIPPGENGPRPVSSFARVNVADFDGNRGKTIFQCAQGALIRSIDWR